MRADIVQVAHHGNIRAVSREVYEEISPRIALWPTPRWLWDNHDSLDETILGQWYSHILKGWLDEIGVRRHIFGFKGLARIELSMEGLRKLKEKR